MSVHWYRSVVAMMACVVLLASQGLEAAPGEAVTLPAGVKAVWDLEKAHQQATRTRGRVSLNGLWQWQPAKDGDGAPPVKSWGYFKVPGSWPGITDYMQKDCQSVFAHPDWKNMGMRDLSAAWYQREFTVPADWAGRRVTLQLEYLNSHAVVYVDGKKVGEARFPMGAVDLTSACTPGSKHVLSLSVVAMPLKAVLMTHRDTAAGKEVKGTVARRGLCGDVWLVAHPGAARIEDLKIDTSVRKWEATVDASLIGLASGQQYTLRARVSREGKAVTELASKPFGAGDLREGRFRFTQSWKADALWDVHTPQHQYDVEVTLSDAGGKAVDAYWPQRIGFREFWIDGRDFYLNGARIYLSAVPLDNAQLGAAWASYEGALESLKRLKSFGINFVYTHNYDCQPGAHLSFAEILRAADDAGVLVALTQPHFSQYDWKIPDADQGNGYAGHAAFYVWAAGNHPSVILWSTSHNATGYGEDMNPDLMDGIADPRDTWSSNNAKLALRAEAIIRKADPAARIVYHHASGNLGSIFSVNYYANFTPVQEQSDWFESWANKGVKPLFTCEYGVPFTWDWTLYRGWYKGNREFGSAKVPWEFCIAEWNAQFVGDRAYAISEPEKANLRWEARQFRAGAGWNRWSYPHEVGSRNFDERFPILAQYTADNWRAFRTWGLSGNSPWEYGHFWKPRAGVDKGRKPLRVDWENLQRPGFSADYIEQRYERMDIAFEPSDWIATPAAQALIRNNGPVLAYIAGKPLAITSKDHNIRAGEVIEKQLIVINNSRQTVTCDATWMLALPQPISGAKQLTLETGQQARIPLRFELPASLPTGTYTIKASAAFSSGQKQEDAFDLHVMPAPAANPSVTGKIALFDPRGQTAAMLKQLGVACNAVEATASLTGYDVLIIGQSALTVDGPAPDLAARVRDGMKVIVFEQSSDVLEQRLGLRVVEYGLRDAYRRLPDHPLLAGIGDEHLHNWRGEATLLPPRLKYTTRPRHGPTVQWCGMPVSHAWRCGNRGNVASVLIEKPHRGDFLPIIDGGYSLQYSPLMEFREGRGMMLFCQMDVTGRTEVDPAAEGLCRNILQYVTTWKPAPMRRAVYAGEAAGKAHLESVGISPAAFAGEKLADDQVLIVGPGGGRELSPHAAAIAAWIKSGGRAVFVGVDPAEVNALLPAPVTAKRAEHIAAHFEPAARNSPLAGIAPADVHSRDPRQLPLIGGGAKVIGDGVLAVGEGSNIIFCQMAPWQFQPAREQHNLKQTWRRSSFLLTRLLCNQGVVSTAPILERITRPAGAKESRWSSGLYVDQPEEWDDPYRFFRW